MPSLTSVSSLPWRPARVLVAGSSGSGKSTMARRIGRICDLPYTEIDSLFHGPGWIARAGFEADVDALVDSERWVTEWQYESVRARLLARADTLVWLAYPRRVTYSRLVRRTVSRRVHATPLWNGNVEPPLRTILTDPDHVIRYAVRHHARKVRVMEQLAATHDPDLLAMVTLRSPGEAERWLAGPLREVSPAGSGHCGRQGGPE